MFEPSNYGPLNSQPTNGNGKHPLETEFDLFYHELANADAQIHAALNHPDHSESKRQADAALLRQTRKQWLDARLIAASHKEWQKHKAEVDRLESTAFDNDPFDPIRLANKKDALPSLLTRFRTLKELKDFYAETKDGYLRRALQEFGAGEISAKFGQDRQLGSFLNRLTDDLDASFTTPELSAAREEQAYFERHIPTKAARVYSQFYSGMFASDNGLAGLVEEMIPREAPEKTIEKPIF